LKQNAGRRIRIVTDVVSSLPMLNSPETFYRFLAQLFTDIKQYDAALFATLKEGMHQPQVLASMQQLYDGVVEMRLYEEGLRVLPLLRVRKMRGVPPQPGYYNFAFTKAGMEVSAYDR
jgi:KaiC/GvpD/RAD55 family RecA-like ATPase